MLPWLFGCAGGKAHGDGIVGDRFGSLHICARLGGLSCVITPVTKPQIFLESRY